MEKYIADTVICFRVRGNKFREVIAEKVYICERHFSEKDIKYTTE